jgi:AcrR family transcriptional regulator
MGSVGEARGASPRTRQILDAARVCFGRHGFHGASMARIAAEASISVGHIYRYFESKEAVVVAIAEEDLAEAAAAMGALEGAPDELARQMLEGFQRSWSAQRMALKLEILAEAARNPTVATAMREMDGRIRDHLECMLRRNCSGCGAVDPVRLAARIDGVCALMDGASLRRFKQGGDFSPALLAELRAALSHALSAPLEPTVAAG